jgi:predicted sugar kinase
MDSVTVTVPARLHLGFLDLNGGLGRKFGSMGLAINGKHARVTVSRADTMKAVG